MQSTTRTVDKPDGDIVQICCELPITLYIPWRVLPFLHYAIVCLVSQSESKGLSIIFGGVK